jgi:Na+/proline symporter
LKYQITKKTKKQKTMKNLLNLSAAFIITFSIFASVFYLSPTKVIAQKEYKIVFGSPIQKINLF